MTQGYRDLGYGSLAEWAHTKLDSLMPPDRVSRLCNVTTNVIAALDAEPWIVDGGEKVDGLTMIARANPTSLMKRSGDFAASDNGERTDIVEGLISGTSDYRRIGTYTPKFGRPQAKWLIREDGVEIIIKATPEQARVIENQIGWMLDRELSE